MIGELFARLEESLDQGAWRYCRFQLFQRRLSNIGNRILVRVGTYELPVWIISKDSENVFRKLIFGLLSKSLKCISPISGRIALFGLLQSVHNECQWPGKNIRTIYLYVTCDTGEHSCETKRDL